MEEKLEGTALAVKELQSAIRARIPLIAVETTEEDRVIRTILEVAGEDTFNLAGDLEVGPRRVFRWTHTEGLRRLGTLPDGYVPEFGDADTSNPSFAIQDYIAFATKDGTIEGFKDHASILVLCDLHRWVMPTQAGGQGDLRTMRALRDLAQLLGPTKSVAVIVGPTLRDLGDADRDVFRVKWPLPTANELAAMVRASAARLSERIPVDINGNAEDVARALAGLTLTEAKRALALAIVEKQRLDDSCIDHITRTKTRILEEQQGVELRPSLPADRVGGLDILKDELAGLPCYLTSEARERKVKPPRGILLAGPPGTGKSLCASVIGDGTMPVLKWSLSESESKWVGESAANVARVLASADAIDNVILLIDEGEKQTSESEGSNVTTQIMGQLLTWMADKESNVVVVMTVNHPEDLRAELVSRFDLKFFVGYPGPAACRQIVEIHTALRDIAIETDGALDALGNLAYKQRLSGREIEDMIDAAHRRAFREGRSTRATDIAAHFGAAKGLADDRKAEVEAMIVHCKQFTMASSEPDGTSKQQEVDVGKDAIEL